MDKQVVMQAANRAAEAEGFQIADYKTTKVVFRSTSSNSTWQVIYGIRDQKARRTADCFWIEVDDKTGEARFLGELSHYDSQAMRPPPNTH